MVRYAEVAVDAPAGYDRTFSYSIPRSLKVRPGQLVRVPFGPRSLQGVIFSLVAAPQVPETRDILSAASPKVILTETQLELARWISRYYRCPLFESIAPMLPPGGRVRPRTYYSLRPETVETDALSLSPLQRRVLQYVRTRGTVEQERLVTSLGEGSRASLRSLVDRKIMSRSVGQSRPSIGPKYRFHVKLTSEAHRGGPAAIEALAARAPRQAELLSHLLDDPSPVGLSDARTDFGDSAVNGLLAKDLIEKARLPIERDPLEGKFFQTSPPVVLTQRQKAVVSEITSTLESDSSAPRTFLVQGVTGSGKTEIYLSAVERCLSLGRKAIVLVPEIALTHQTVERFATRFPEQVAVLHSGLSQGERHDQWWKIERGEYGVVIGSRGAVFAPQAELGLIIVDEEHEWTYKQHDASPRYHAREVALQLGKLTGAVVVLGSATPDLVSYHRSLRREFRLLTLPDRVSVLVSGGVSDRKASPLASVQIVDMRRELREGNRGIFSRALHSSMRECLDNGGQIILFLNRRGSASYTQCRNCGASLQCRRCDIALTYHKESDRLICHYCGVRRTAPAKCPRCMSYRMSHYGVGTEGVVKEVSELFPQANTLRFDRDATRGPGAHDKLLERFRSGEAQVLVGTQMVAKGHHFPSVNLVGVVSADTGLNIPDYRAGERTFQLLCQVAGRAGRGPLAGRVIIQTYQPDNYAVQAASRQDFQRYYEEEMRFRQDQANPPLSKLIRLVYTHTNLARCEVEAVRMVRAITEQREAWGYSDIDLLGPTPAYPARLRGHYRWHLVLRGPEPRLLLDRVEVPNGWTVDIDPVTLT